MTAIPSWFTHQMSRMADLRNAPSALHMWWEGLQGVPLEVLEAAVTHAIQTRQWFPSPAELRDDADLAVPARPVPPTSTPWCEQCQDTGWRETVPSAEAVPRAVARCECWDRSPVLMARRAAAARYARGRQR